MKSVSFFCLKPYSLIFFFQAEDGIRVGHVTVVQTCALPICILYDVLNQPLERIDDKEVRRWLADNTHRPGSANFAFIRLRAFLNWCAKQDAYKHLVHGDACIKNNDFVPESKPAKGEGIQREQLKVWFEEVKKIENEVFSAYLQVLLLTGARRNEIGRASC